MFFCLLRSKSRRLWIICKIICPEISGWGFNDKIINFSNGGHLKNKTSDKSGFKYLPFQFFFVI